MIFTELPIIRWLHILAMVYWLGGEWGVFQTSKKVVNRKLGIDERKRHMETAYRIDILARTGIITIMPLGLHMGYLWGLHSYGGAYLVAMWIFVFAWVTLCWAAFAFRETDRGIRLTKIDEAVRYVVIPLLIIAGISSLLGNGPFSGEEGQRWYATKALIFSVLLMLGLKLRYIMREWTIMFRLLDANENQPEVAARLERSQRIGEGIAYCYWVLIATMGFLGAVKPF